MVEISDLNYKNITFTRDTQVDYKSGNPIINCIFKQWDTDMSGDFNDNEWDNYQKSLEQIQQRKEEIQSATINEEVVEIYNRKLEESQSKYAELHDKFQSIDSTAWDKFLEFEESHPAITRNYGNYKEENLVPKDALEIDITPFNVGIYDETNDRFTGEICKKGYITGLENLSETERNEYMKLLNNALEACRLINECVEQEKKIEQEFDKNKALVEMAQIGEIDEILSIKEETELYSKYVSIRNYSNPFYQEIQKLEQKRTALLLKGHKTAEDERLIEQYSIRIEQLTTASIQWKLEDSGKSIKENDSQSWDNQAGIKVSDLSQNITYPNLDSPKISATHSVGLNWGVNSNLDLSAQASSTFSAGMSDTRDLALDKSFNAEITGNYYKENLNITSTLSFSDDNSMTNFSPNITAAYKKLSISITENINKLKPVAFQEENNEQNESEEDMEIPETISGSVRDTNIALSYQTGKFTNTASVNLTESDSIYSLASNAEFNQKLSSTVKLKILPSMSASYNNKAETYTFSPALSLTGTYGTQDYKAEINMSESHSTTIAHHSRPEMNHSFNASGSFTRKNWTTTLKFNDTDSSDSHSNTYGIETSYTTDAGTFSAEFSHQKSNDKAVSLKNITNMLSISCSIPTERISDWLNSWFK